MSVTELTSDYHEQQFINTHERAVIFFGSERCPHCRDMVPVIHDMARKYSSIGFAHVEVSEIEVENVKGVPVFVGYRNQNPVEVIVGARVKALTEMITTKLAN